MSRGAPLPPYIKDQGGCGRPREGRARRNPTPTGSRTPSLPCWIRRRGEGRGREEGKGAPPPPCPIRTRGGGGVRPALAAPPLLHFGPMRPINPRGVPVTPPHSGKIPISLGTLPMSKCRLPIYQSLCIDHFETPRHVRDHIRDSEQTSAHQNA